MKDILQQGTYINNTKYMFVAMVICTSPFEIADPDSNKQAHCIVYVPMQSWFQFVKTSFAFN
jgi:hypothetical protein